MWFFEKESTLIETGRGKGFLEKERNYTVKEN
jgi:hypothetical protein